MSTIVLCIDDTGRYTQATRAVFDLREQAERYAATLSQARKPVLMTIDKHQAEALQRIQQEFKELSQ